MAISKNQMNVIIGIMLLLTGILLGIAFIGTNHSSETQNQSDASNTISSANVCYFDWAYKTTKQVGNYYEAPSDCNYALVTVYLKNEADKLISTNPNYWTLDVNGIIYSADVATYSNEIKHQTVEVTKGGEIETQIVYLVKGNPSEATLIYKGPWTVKMERTNFYEKAHASPPDFTPN